MDIKAKVLRNLSYGLYLIGVMDGERPCGCIVNTVFQVTSENPIVAISMNKNNYTWELLEREGRFAVSILSEKTRKEVIQKLGFVSGRDHDKYEGIDYTMRDGLPVLNEQCCGALICKVVSVTETPTHMVVLASVAEAYELAATVPMTYRYYHEVIRGGAPKNAPSIFPSSEASMWQTTKGRSIGAPLLQLSAVAEGAAHLFAEHMVGAVRRLERDGTEFCKIDAAVRDENAFIDADVDDSADDVAVLVDPDQLALERDRQLVDQRRVDKFALCDVEAGLFHLLRLRIGGDHAHVVGGDDVRRIRKADRKGALLADVRRGSVACAQAELHLVGVIEAAPRGVHRVRGAVRIVGGDDQHRQRVEPRFHTKTLSHSKHSFYSIQFFIVVPARAYFWSSTGGTISA